MKTRQGFVSNSSSSSFVIIGKEINIRSAIDLQLNFNPKEKGILIADDLCDGDDVIFFDYDFVSKFIEQFDHIEAMYKIEYLSWFKNAISIDCNEDVKMTDEFYEKIPHGKNVVIKSIQKDYHSCPDFESFLDRYVYPD